MDEQQWFTYCNQCYSQSLLWCSIRSLGDNRWEGKKVNLHEWEGKSKYLWLWPFHLLLFSKVLKYFKKVQGCWRQIWKKIVSLQGIYNTRSQDITKWGEANRLRLCSFLPEKSWVSLDPEEFLYTKLVCWEKGILI